MIDVYILDRRNGSAYIEVALAFTMNPLAEVLDALFIPLNVCLVS